MKPRNLRIGSIKLFAFLVLFISFGVANASEIELKITSLTNIRGQGATLKYHMKMWSLFHD